MKKYDGSKKQPLKRLSGQALQQALTNSECLFSKAQVMAAYDDLAQRLNAAYVGLNPIVFVAMKGGLIPAGQLMMRLSIFHRMAYLHATRYYDKNQGGSLTWLVRPECNIAGEHVLVIDDIFDEGITFKAIIEELKQGNPQSIKTCVLVNKVHNRKAADFLPDFIGLEAPDRFIFGCGMDYYGYLRHLDGIYALNKP